jgi:hypothetical protein
MGPKGVSTTTFPGVGASADAEGEFASAAEFADASLAVSPGVADLGDPEVPVEVSWVGVDGREEAEAVVFVC